MTDQGDHFIGNIFTMCAPNKESRLLESHLVGILVWEIAQVVERLS